MDTRNRKIDKGNIGNKTQKDRHGKHWTFVYLSVSSVQCCPCLSFCVLCSLLPVSICLCLVPNVARVYHCVSCVQCCPCLSFSVWCPLVPVSIFLCLVPNVTHVYLSVSYAQCYPCLSFCILCPMLPVSIFLCLIPNVARVSTLGTRHRKIDTGNIAHKTQKDRHGQHWTQDTER
jgi:hypothetical protein